MATNYNNPQKPTGNQPVRPTGNQPVRPTGNQPVRPTGNRVAPSGSNTSGGNPKKPIVETNVGEDYEEYTVGSVVANIGSSIGYALIYVVMVIGISVILACVGWVLANDLLALNKVPQTVEINVEEYDTFETVSRKLKEAGLIDYEFLFDIFATVTKSKDDIGPGIYTVDSDMDYNALIRNLGADSSTRVEIDVTIPEGYTIDQIFALLEEKGVATVSELEEKAAYHNYAFDFLQEIPLGDHRRLEGYLFPDTYTFYSRHDPLYVINKMLINFYYKVVADDSIMKKVEDSGYTLHEVVNMAAMIERETDGTDRANIASVIFNRLHNPSYETAGRLQIDATIYYLTGREVTQNDRETIQNPYNTHINAGLPPGPICNPGSASITAVLDPASTKYYYYALGDDDLHHYYTTYNSFLGFLASQNRYNS